MAAEQKTEQPTAKRREEARKRGQVARSPEVASVATLAGIMAVLATMGVSLLTKLEQSMSAGLSLQLYPRGGDFSATFAESVGLAVAKATLLDVLPFLGVILGLSLVANAAQTGLRFSPSAMNLKLSKLNPLTGVKRFVSARMYVEFAKSLAKLLAVSLVVILSVMAQWHSLLLLGGSPPGEIVVFAGKLILSISEKVIGLMIVIAAADYGFQRHQTTKELKMTKQEIKDETKQQEMSPHMRARIRQAARALARSRMLTQVPQADVVITNPTHFACAVRYDKTVSDAPILLAKGKDLLAEEIKRIAKENGIPLIENRPLARALYRTVEPGGEIPAELWMTVAEILAYVYQLQNRTDF